LTNTGSGLKLASWHPSRDLRIALVNGVVMGNSLLAIEPRSKDTISEDAIRDQLSRILESSIFVQSERLGQFLRFTVETTLESKAETLKEYVVGTHVYGRKPPYHPTEDSIVRSEARRLRRKLQEFYETIGKDDLVLIRYRPGSYVPVFKMRGEESTPPAVAPRPGDAFPQRPGLRVAVLPFVDLSTGALSGVWAQFLTDDLIHQLVRTDGVRVITGYSERRVTSRVVNSDGFGFGQNASKRTETLNACLISQRESHRR
jgi:hypothetical protein